MLAKVKEIFKNCVGLLKKHYIFLACCLFIFIGINMLDSNFWSYRSEGADKIAVYIKSGTKIIAGSVLIGASLIALAISKLVTSK